MKPSIASMLMLATLLSSFARCLHAEPPPEIRVLVIDAVPSIAIEGVGSPLRIASPAGRGEEWAGAAVKVIAGESGLAMKGLDRGREIVFTNKSRRYKISGRSFRGTLDIVWRENGSLIVVDSLPLEEYLAGLINSEISSSWPVEAIKAQAVAARTYAMNQIEGARHAMNPRPFDITSTMLDQVYDGAHQEDDRSHEAVRATRGEVLLRSGAIFPAYYHSCCGGMTEHAHNVWPGGAGPPVVEDRYCARSPKLLWSWQVPISRFAEVLRSQDIPIGVVRTIATSALPDSPRVGELLIEDDDGLRMVKATDLRRIFGYQNVKSTWFDVATEGSEIVFTGRGYGHGVGLCQWGAKGMAEEGIGYRDILKFYYPDAEVVRIY